MTVSLGGDETVLVISGPNTGGKTVALKTIGLAVLAAQSGIPVSAQSARLAIFDRVFADIGDEQSIAADLSTFSAHILNLKAILESVTVRSLVLADEMGPGTAPEALPCLCDHTSRPAQGVRVQHSGRCERQC
jgi:DNA mismatch repair protein MutS2